MPLHMLAATAELTRRVPPPFAAPVDAGGVRARARMARRRVRLGVALGISSGRDNRRIRRYARGGGGESRGDRPCILAMIAMMDAKQIVITGLYNAISSCPMRIAAEDDVNNLHDLIIRVASVGAA